MRKTAEDAALAKVDGTWIIKSIERDPRERGKDEGKGIRCIIENGRVTVYMPAEDKPIGHLTIAVVSDKRPMTMLITPDGEEVSLKAIYRQRDDKLTVCWKSIEEKLPPTEFSAKPGTGQTLLELQRSKN
jgi:uncharacterized protein (TIGR03067 family)